MRLYSVVIAIFLAASCFLDAAAAEEIDWNKTGPLEFLDMLKSGGVNYVTIGRESRPPDGWIDENDLWELIQLVGSREPAGAVVSDRSVYVPTRMSSVGNEAMYLIEGYRAGNYPPTVSSVYDFRPDPRAYREWWNARMRSQGEKKTGALAVFVNSPTREEILGDSKPAGISALDALIMRAEGISLGSGVIQVLVSRLSSKVEYVWSPVYMRYVRPEFIMQNAQDLYDNTRR